MKIQHYGVIFLIVFLLFTFYFSLVSAVEWSGIDESVIEKFAKEHGREPKEPLINTDQGDLSLFIFLIGGGIGGFAAGYYWRTLTERRAKSMEAKNKE